MVPGFRTHLHPGFPIEKAGPGLRQAVWVSVGMIAVEVRGLAIVRSCAPFADKQFEGDLVECGLSAT